MRILALAYACEPDKGSEPGAGWVWAHMLSRLGETVVVTRSNNRDSIEKAITADDVQPPIRFEYVDLPAWARFWKRGQRGIRTYYMLWQWLAYRRARRLLRTESFDLGWHLTMANGWMGSTWSLLPLPFIYGPIGGGIGLRFRLLRTMGPRGIAFELGRGAMRACGRYGNPLARLAWSRARLILVQNEETRSWLPHNRQSSAVVFPNAIAHEISPNRSRVSRTEPTALFAGRLVALKGIELALLALKATGGWTLIVCGDGPDRTRLESRSRELGVEKRVRFVGWLSRSEVGTLMAEEADVFLFPSLHDESPLAVVEAVAQGLPVICLDIGGAPVIAGAAATVISSAGTPLTIASALGEAVGKRDYADGDVVARRAGQLTLESRVADLCEHVDPILDGATNERAR